MDKIYNFAENLNPFGPPTWAKKFLKDPNSYFSYPELWHNKVDSQINDILGLENDAKALAIPGTSSFIYSFPALLEKHNGKRMKWGVVNPSFWEYEDALKSQNLNYSAFDIRPLIGKPADEYDAKLVDFVSTNNIEALILCVPNNPTGQTVSLNAIREINRKSPETKILMDLTYSYFQQDFNDYVDMLNDQKIGPNTIIFCSLSKFFAMPGLRIGFCAFGNNDLYSAIRQSMGPVRINSAAEKITPMLMSDYEYINTCRSKLSADSKNLKEDISKQIKWLTPINTDSCFALYKISDDMLKKLSANDIKDRLMKDNILVASGSIYNLDEYIRIRAGTKADNNKLLAAMNKLSKSSQLINVNRPTNKFRKIYLL